MCLFPFLLWLASFVMFCLFALIENLWNRSLFLQKRALCYTSTQEEMRYEGSQIKVPPITRKRMTPAFVQDSYTSFEGAGKLRRGRQRMECERQNNYRKNETVFGKKFQCEGEGEGNWKMLGPEDVDVDFRRILKGARDERRRKRNRQLE